MSAVQNPPATSSILYWLCRGVFLESIRRREISVVLLFMGLFAIGAVTARFVGAETDAAATFILNLGISLAWILAMLVSILMAGRQFPDELENRSLYPLLAKPVSRSQYILGKWLATWLAGSATSLVLNLIAIIASPWPESLSVFALIQTIILEIFALGMAGAIAIAFSIRTPKAVGIVLTALLVFAGGPLVALLKSTASSGTGRSIITWLTGYIPNFSELDLINAFSAGSPGVVATDFIVRAAYAAIVTVFALALAMLLLEKKPL